MIFVPQRSDHSRIWFEAKVRDNGDGTLTIPATTFWLAGVGYEMAEYSPTVGSEPFWLRIEKIQDGAGYALDFTGFDEPATFGPGLGAPGVVWRDSEEDEISVLRSVKDA